MCIGENRNDFDVSKSPGLSYQLAPITECFGGIVVDLSHIEKKSFPSYVDFII